jgi:hypothetical protein
MSDNCGDPCDPLIPVPPIDDCIVQFDFTRWSARYPEFTKPPFNVSSVQAQELFYDACLMLDNSCNSPVCDASIGGERERLLYMLTAHIAYLSGPGSGQQVGIINSKSVGSVSVGYQVPQLPATAAWFAQSKYGFAFYQATAQYRLFRYRPFTGVSGQKYFPPGAPYPYMRTY